MIISTLQSIAHPTNKVFENDYRHVYFDVHSGIMLVQLNYPEFVPQEEVLSLGRSVAFLVQKYRPKKILGDISRYFYHDTDLRSNLRYSGMIFPRLQKAGCDKLAVVVPTSLLSFAYVDSILQQVQTSDPEMLEVRYFDFDSEALRWLSKN